jgi:hypothetical protein
MNRLLASVICLLLLLPACASVIDPEDCATTDWFVEGREVGRNGGGDADASLAARQEVCGAGAVDRDLFLLGYREGNAAFCRADVAFYETAKRVTGEDRFNICPLKTRIAAGAGSGLRDEVDAVRTAITSGQCRQLPDLSFDGFCKAEVSCVNTCQQIGVLARTANLGYDCQSVCRPIPGEVDLSIIDPLYTPPN